MMPTLSGSTYTVSLTGAPSGASVRTTSGETKSGNIFNSGESFVVRVPASSITSTTTNLTVNVSTSATVKKAYIYAPDSSVANADEIQRVTKNMKDSFDDLNTFMQKYATSQIRTDWMDQVYANWQKYQEGDIPETLADMNLSATNIKNTVDESVKYSREEQ